MGGQSYDDGEEESHHHSDVEHPKGESHFPEEKPLRRNSERGDKERGGGHPIHGASRRDGRSPMDQFGRLVRGPSARPCCQLCTIAVERKVFGTTSK